MNNIIFALILSSLAGFSTAIGGLIVYVKKQIGNKSLSFAMGFSAGVMIWISLTELINSSKEMFLHNFNEKSSAIFILLSFFVGVILMRLIDLLLPDPNHLHKSVHINVVEPVLHNQKLLRSGILTAVVIALHNFPEGLTTFSISASNVKLALPIIVAIAIHNIPEGVAVAVPIYRATGKRRKAFLWSLFSGLTEPLGGLIGYLLLAKFISSFVLGALYSFVAGIMVYISLMELLPLSNKYNESNFSFYGLFFGMLTMAFSLILFMWHLKHANEKN